MMGTLYLIPNTLGKTPENNTIPEYVLSIVRRLDSFIVENIQSAVSYLNWVGDTVPEYEIRFYELNKNTKDEEMAELITPLIEGKDTGLLSEAGCPAVADPGSRLIRMAHARGIDVVPLTGPSSILLALMASGFNGQQFAFHGYLPIEKDKRIQMIQKLEQESRNSGRTQIFMEAPHRNSELVRDVVKTCGENTRFCCATNLTLPGERIVTKPIKDWKVKTGDLIQKNPTIFLLHAGVQ